MGTVALVCAMPMELRPLTRQLHLRKANIDGFPAHTGRLGRHDVVAVVTGMGTALASQGTERLLAAVTPDHVMVVGITGAVADDVAIGTVVVPELVVNSTTGGEHRPHPVAGVTPHGVMWTTDVVTPPADCAALRARGVVALDMETAAIAECCERHGIPWSVIRVVSDRATDGSVDDEVFGLSHQDGSPNAPAILRYVAHHPLRVPKLVSLAKGAKLATERAAAAAIDAVLSLP